jgi:hypothetical protein
MASCLKFIKMTEQSPAMHILPMASNWHNKMVPQIPNQRNVELVMKWFYLWGIDEAQKSIE